MHGPIRGPLKEGINLDQRAPEAVVVLRDIAVELIRPNALQPRWITEGLAVHAESEAGRSYGRLGNSQFEGMMRAEAGRGLRERNHWHVLQLARPRER